MICMILAIPKVEEIVINIIPNMLGKVLTKTAKLVRWLVSISTVVLDDIRLVTPVLPHFLKQDL